MYYTYMIRCEDNSIYTGITTDLERRMKEHYNKTEKCAKYTLSHNMKKIEIAWKSENKKLASKLEYHIKKLSKTKKEYLIKNPKDLDSLFSNKIDGMLYQPIIF